MLPIHNCLFKVDNKEVYNNQKEDIKGNHAINLVNLFKNPVKREHEHFKIYCKLKISKQNYKNH